jgi:PST family polysaccharide transporter
MTTTTLIDNVAPAAAKPDHLGIEHLRTKVESRAVSGGLVSALAQGSQLLLTMVYTGVLARLLSPGDFGLVALGMAVAGFLLIFKDAGLSTATIQRDNITHAQVSNLFWINVCVGALAALSMAASAPLVAWFFRQPALAAITMALSVSFIFDGIAVQHTALLNRQMRFQTISFIEVGSVALGYVVGITMAMTGFSYWSLVGATVMTAVCRVTAIWIVSPWRPQLPARGSGTRPLIRFGADLTLVGVVYAIARSADSLLIGRFLGSEAVGIYSRATALLNRPIDRLVSPIYAVIVPVLSRLQSEPERYRQAYLQVFEGLAIAGFIFAGTFLPLAQPTVAVILGPRWHAAAPVFAALSVAAIYIPLSSSTSWLYTSQGRGRDLLITAVIGACVMIGSFVASLSFGVKGIAIAYSAAGVLVALPVTCYIVGRRGPVSTADLARAFFRHLPVGLAVLATTSLAARATLTMTPWVRLVLCVPAGTFAAAACVMLLPDSRRTAMRAIRAITDMKRRTR